MIQFKQCGLVCPACCEEVDLAIIMQAVVRCQWCQQMVNDPARQPLPEYLEGHVFPPDCNPNLN
jgi:hypothetical protein